MKILLLKHPKFGYTILFFLKKRRVVGGGGPGLCLEDLGKLKGHTILLENKITPLRTTRGPIESYPRPTISLIDTLIS